MRRGKIALFFAATLVGVGVFSGCQAILNLFRSDEALIISFSVQGMVGVATIDPNAKTVVVTVEPMDLSSVTPTVTVSEKATLNVTALADGEPVVFAVTAENGKVVNWQVTVNVQFGLSFELDGTKAILREGVYDPTNTDNDALWGSGGPAGAYWPSEDASLVVACSSDYNIADPNATPDASILMFGFDGGPADPQDVGASLAMLTYLPVAHDSYRISGSSDVAGTGSWDFQVLSYGEVGEPITGAFSWTGAQGSDSTTHNFANGFFKVTRLADNSLPM